MLKSLLAAAALLALPAAAAAQMSPAPGALPKCTAKVQDSCDQSTTTEKNAIDYYPADSRDAGNNKIGKATAMKAKPARRAKAIEPMNAAATPGDPVEPAK